MKSPHPATKAVREYLNTRTAVKVPVPVAKEAWPPPFKDGRNYDDLVITKTIIVIKSVIKNLFVSSCGGSVLSRLKRANRWLIGDEFLMTLSTIAAVLGTGLFTMAWLFTPNATVYSTLMNTPPPVYIPFGLFMLPVVLVVIMYLLILALELLYVGFSEIKNFFTYHY